MAHELEIVNGNAQMAYVGDVPWHGLGTKVPLRFNTRTIHGEGRS